MAGNQHRDPVFPVQLQDQLPHLHDSLGVQPVYRFIQHQKIRITRKGNGNPQTLTHPQGKILGLFPACARKPHQFQQFCDSLIRRAAQDRILFPDIFFSRHIEINGWIFNHRSHSAAHLQDIPGCVLFSVNGILPGCWALQAADQPDQSGLSRSVSSDEAVNSSFFHMHGQMVQCFKIFILFC